MWSKRAGVANEYAFVVFEPPVLERPSSAAGPRRRISPGPFPNSSAPCTTRVLAGNSWPQSRASICRALASDAKHGLVCFNAWPGEQCISATNPAVTHWHFSSFQIIAEILGVAILAGIGARLVILALGLLKLRQFRRASSPNSLSAESAAALEQMRAQLRARAEFRLSTDVDSPVTFGLAAPVILLPERFLAMNAQSQAAIACHELLHVRRHDWAHHLAEETIGAVLWFHPGIAWLIARIRLAREQVVDLDVLRLTNARKPYLEALLEFANARGSLATIPAPPFLAERQLVERITLMLKEVRMSRTRLVASLTASSCGIALAIIFAVWSFPLKAAPHFGPYPPQRGVVAPGVSGGVG